MISVRLAAHLHTHSKEIINIFRCLNNNNKKLLCPFFFRYCQSEIFQTLLDYFLA